MFNGGYQRGVCVYPVAEFFLYDLVFRNRACFRRRPDPRREVFGFGLSGGTPLSTIQAYADFKRAIAANRHRYSSCAYFDITAYFNHIYHHDLVRWFEDAGAPKQDVETMGKYLRETASGRSVDCLPQGLYPAKMIGSGFLSFLESQHEFALPAQRGSWTTFGSLTMIMMS